MYNSEFAKNHFAQLAQKALKVAETAAKNYEQVTEDGVRGAGGFWDVSDERQAEIYNAIAKAIETIADELGCSSREAADCVILNAAIYQSELDIELDSLFSSVVPDDDAQ